MLVMYFAFLQMCWAKGSPNSGLPEVFCSLFWLHCQMRLIPLHEASCPSQWSLLVVNYS